MQTSVGSRLFKDLNHFICYCGSGTCIRNPTLSIKLIVGIKRASDNGKVDFSENLCLWDDVNMGKKYLYQSKSLHKNSFKISYKV